MQDEAVCRSRR